MPYWTEEEKLYLEKTYRKIDTKQISKTLKRSIGTVRQQAISLGLSKKKEDCRIKNNALFGRWTVISESNIKTSDGSNKYLCICSCGNQKYIRRASLLDGSSLSCGCLTSEKVRDTHSLEDGQTSFNSLYTQCKRAANSRKLEFNLTREEHKKLIIQDCHYCGKAPIKYSRYESKVKSDIKNNVKVHITNVAVDRSWIYVNTIDRVDSDKGYFKENCVPSCLKCNRMKLDYPLTDFISHVNKIVEFQNKKSKPRLEQE